MKKILYICSKNQYDWETFIPRQNSSPMEETEVSILLLQQEKHLQHFPSSQVFTLETEERTSDDPFVTISYQEFLEKIFLADLPLVV